MRYFVYTQDINSYKLHFSKVFSGVFLHFSKVFSDVFYTFPIPNGNAIGGERPDCIVLVVVKKHPHENAIGGERPKGARGT